MSSHQKITEDFHTGAQVGEADFEKLAAAGFKSVINNRPDDEEPGQLDHERAAAAAERAGLAYRYVPVSPTSIGEEDVESFARALEELPKPVFAHCRSGMRSTALWALSQVSERGIDDVMGRAAAAGYDLSALRSRLESRQQA
ncbi:MAG: TIGR01244 family sulfur transferase [Rhodovibrionaceae bacterium]|nr:TIGR01244 family sulfur transferase [Rhodovibrionaceae bacterium]